MIIKQAKKEDFVKTAFQTARVSDGDEQDFVFKPILFPTRQCFAKSLFPEH